MIAYTLCTAIFISFGSIGYSFLLPLQRCSYYTASMRGTEIMSLADDSSIQHINFKNAASGALRSSAVASAAFFFSNIILDSHGQNLHLTDFGRMIMPSSVQARNLPISNGASGVNRGTAVTLVPILQLKNAIDIAIGELPNIPKCEAIFSRIPLIEKDFKKLFDEHSEGISYKQQFLDQNAFLVYYTRGFDGPGRPSIEDEDSASIKEKGQFGARNDAWVAVDDARSEISYLLEFKNEKVNTKDLKKSLISASKAFTDYLSYDSPELVKEAESLLLL